MNTSHYYCWLLVLIVLELLILIMVTPSLPKVEIILYFSLWISVFTYATYHVYLAGKILDPSAGNENFTDGWFGYKKDITHKKWRNGMNFTLPMLSKWAPAHVVLTQLTRWFSPEHIPAVHCLTTISMICVHFGPVAAVLMFLHASFYFLVLLMNSVAKTWILGPPFATIFCYVLHDYWLYNGGERFHFDLLMISSMWQHLRCTSYVIDHVSSDNKSTRKSFKSYYDLIGYCFYLPTFFTGPFILYSDFGPYICQPFEQITWKRIGSFVFNSLRFIFWAAVVEASLHLLYIHALEKHVSQVAELGGWTLGGLALLLGVFFNMYLFVFYGFGITFARFDGYNPPPPPKCTLHYHLYSDIWRVLDVGYYRFMHKYVYRPLCGTRKDWRRSLLASTVCFSFVFFWHGISSFVLIWFLLNWLAVTLVSLAATYSNSDAYKKWERLTISENNRRRLAALLTAPILLLGSTSSAFLFCGVQTGSLFFKEAFLNCSWLVFSIEMFICYCVCQVSIETKRWEREKVIKVIPN